MIKIADVCIFIDSYSDLLCEQLQIQYADLFSSTEDVDLEIAICPPSNQQSAISNRIPFFRNCRLFREADGYTLWFHGYWGKIDIEFRSAILFADYPSITVVELFMGFCLSLYLSLHNGIIIHGCGIVDNEQGYLFAGESESGKSTIASLAEYRTVLSDEATIIRKQSGHFRLYGAPWIEGIFCNDMADLDSIFFLQSPFIYKSQIYLSGDERDSHLFPSAGCPRFLKRNRDENHVLSEAEGIEQSNLNCIENIKTKFEPLTAAQSTIKMLLNRFYPNKYMMDKIFELCIEICSKTPCYDMYFVPDKALIWRDINEIRSMSS